MEVVATVDFNFADVNKTGGELELSNWDEQVKIVSVGIAGSVPIYVDRADLLRAIAALDVAAE